LPTWLPGRSPTIADIVAAGEDVAALARPSRLPLQDSDYWRGVQGRASELPATPRARRLAEAVERLTAQFGTAEITFTASHGDWSPWNMWLTDRGLLVWDWERFERETPQGFDLLHFRLNDQLIRGTWTRVDAAHRLIAEAPDLLTADPSRTALLYLLTIGLRYEADGQAAAGAAIGRLEDWLLPALEAGIADPAPAKRA
jgi:hypothetical protein